MNAAVFRQFYAYHFAENRKIWDTFVTTLSDEQFNQDVAYSVGSVRKQLVHLMSCDNYWFSALRGLELPDMYDPADFPDRTIIRIHWDRIEQNMRDYLAQLRDDMLFDRPFPDGEDHKLILWQVLLHVVNHGTDHRAQLLRLLNDLGLNTSAQDYIFYVFDHL